MDQYKVTGMHCAACSARVEKAVSKVDGVERCTVNLLTNSMAVEGTASPDQIRKAVKKAGYGAKPMKSKKKVSVGQEQDTFDTDGIEGGPKDEIQAQVMYLISSLVFLLPLMYVSMGHHMWNWPVFPSLEGNYLGLGIWQMLLATVVLVINQRFFINGWKGIFHGALNMDTLVSLGSGISYLWSAYVLIRMTVTVNQGDMVETMESYHLLYFESAAMILTLITVGKLLEAISKGRTTNALKGLMELAPKTAHLLREGEEITVPVDQVSVGDLYVVHPGEWIPVDGTVLEGESFVDESALTGEPLAKGKYPEDPVSTATMNQSGVLTCKATRVGEERTIAKIIQMVNDATATKAPVSKIADRVSGIFVPIVMGIAVLTFMIWLFTGADLAFALERGIAVLVISCPCALGLATPVAVMVGNGVGARNGILFKTSEALEMTGKVKICALDKTGTITEGKPNVTRVFPAAGVLEEELISLAKGVEAPSKHPLAQAVTDYGNILGQEIQNFREVPGKGVEGICEGERVKGGNYGFLVEPEEVGLLKNPEELEKHYQMESQGMSVIYYRKGEQYLGALAIEDRVKEDSKEAIAGLKELGIKVVMITGDSEGSAKKVADEVQVDGWIGNVLPGEKEQKIRELKKEGKIMMVGDGINDAPALTTADVGVGIGAGTDIAMDAADVVLVHSKLQDVVTAVRLSKKTIRNIYENLFWAFIYNIIGIPLAAGAWIHLLGWSITPMFGAFAMSLSSVCVVSNALRLNFFQKK